MRFVVVVARGIKEIIIVIIFSVLCHTASRCVAPMFLFLPNACVIIILFPQPSGPTRINGSMLAIQLSITDSVRCSATVCTTAEDSPRSRTSRISLSAARAGRYGLKDDPSA